MHEGEEEIDRSTGPLTRLLEDSWKHRGERAGDRELVVEALAGGTFLLLALPLGLTALLRHPVDPLLVGLLIGLYALVAGAIRFPIGAGYMVPSYLILVPMLLLLPPATVPMFVAVALVIAGLVRGLTGRVSSERILVSLPNAWPAIGPALVLVLAGRLPGGPITAGVYLAAFLAGCAVDFATSTLREFLILGLVPRLQLRVAVVVSLVDACIAPLGFLLVHVGRHNHLALLLALPFSALLWILERERSARIAQAQLRLEMVVREGTRLQTALREAVTDPLTGLGNRRKLGAELGERLLPPATGDPDPFLLLLFDLDGFKGYNDTFGHQAGDVLLAHLGGRLAGAVAPEGTAYRLGGDEFCVLLPAALGEMQEQIARAAAALREHGERFSISASCGAVLLPHEASTPDYALQLADQRMYLRKQRRPSAVREQTRDVLVRIMHAKQLGLPNHSSGVADLAIRVGRRLGMTAEQIDELARAGELHDIGKVGLPDAILGKPGALDPDEEEFVRQHTILGERILSAAPALRPVATIVRASHERWDGHGYPDGLGGEEIPLAARIVAVCDAYEAITSDRCYRPARSPDTARLELLHEAGHQFDPQVVAAFIAQLEQPDQAPTWAVPAEDEQAQALAGQVSELFSALLQSDRPAAEPPPGEPRAT